MKFFVAVALFAAVAQASILLPVNPAAVQDTEVQEILAAINHPSTDPTTAAMLEQMLYEILGISKPEPIEVGPAIVDEYEPISVGPAIVDEYETISVGPAIVDPAPEAVAEAPSAPLVQIILNINSQSSSIVGSPVAIEASPVEINPTPVVVVDNEIEPEPVLIVEPEPEPAVIGTPTLPSPIIPVPIIPAPVAVLPEELN